MNPKANAATSVPKAAEEMVFCSAKILPFGPCIAKEKKQVEKKPLNEILLAEIATLTRMQLRQRYKSTYGSWSNMKQRCRHGKTLSPEFTDFRDFLRHMGPKPGPGYSLDRIDSKNPVYGPGECRWADIYTQNQNRKNSVRINCNGESLTAAEWARRTDQKAETLRRRKKNGWTDREVVVGRAVVSATGQRGPRRSWPPFADPHQWQQEFVAHRLSGETFTEFVRRFSLGVLKAHMSIYGECLDPRDPTATLPDEIQERIMRWQTVARWAAVAK